MIIDLRGTEPAHRHRDIKRRKAVGLAGSGGMSRAQQRGAFTTVPFGGARIIQPAVAFSHFLSLTHCGSGDNGALLVPSLPTFF